MASLKKLIQEFLQLEGFSATVSELSQLLNLEIDSLEFIGILGFVMLYPKIFCVSPDKNRSCNRIQLSPHVTICSAYNSSVPCKSDCNDLHVCLMSLLNLCSESDNCLYSHDLNSIHNQKVFAEYNLEGTYHKLLRQLLQRSCQNVMPGLCQDYNYKSCTIGYQGCRLLHLCEKFITGECTRMCALNHNVMHPQCLRMLSHFGVDPEEVQGNIEGNYRNFWKETFMKKKPVGVENLMDVSDAHEFVSAFLHPLQKQEDGFSESRAADMVEQDKNYTQEEKTWQELLVTTAKKKEQTSVKIQSTINADNGDIGSKQRYSEDKKKESEHCASELQRDLGRLTVEKKETLLKELPKNEDQQYSEVMSHHSPSQKLKHASEPNKIEPRQEFLEKLPKDKQLLKAFFTAKTSAERTVGSDDKSKELKGSSESQDPPLQNLQEQLPSEVKQTLQAQIIGKYLQSTEALSRNSRDKELKSVSDSKSTELQKNVLEQPSKDTNQTLLKASSLIKSDGQSNEIASYHSKEQEEDLQSFSEPDFKILSFRPRFQDDRDHQLDTRYPPGNTGARSKHADYTNNSTYTANDTPKSFYSSLKRGAKSLSKTDKREENQNNPNNRNRKGNVSELCIYNLDKKCKEVSEKCINIHYPYPYAWEVYLNNNWLFMGTAFSEMMEKSFRDPFNLTYNIPKPESDMPHDLVDFLCYYPAEEMSIDFEQFIMFSKTSEKLPVRRLSTPSDAVANSQWSTSWEWYFDNYNVWTCFGYTNAVGVGDRALTMRLEKEFVQNKKFLPINVNGMPYILDFQKLVQINEISRKERKLRRRPAIMQPYDQRS